MKKNNIVRRSKKKYSETGITLLALVITIMSVKEELELQE